LKKFDLAQKTAGEALVVAEKINERSEIAGCYRVFAQVAVHNGEKEKAIEYYKKAVDIFKLIQSRYELAMTRYLMATSGLFDNGERMALLYLAREYFVSEEIEHYIEKVEVAIKKYRSTVSSVTDKTPHSMASTQTVFIASHPKIRKIVEFAENVAESNMTVFLTGPTGSGKDHLARYIHECSDEKASL
jgi:transcriptional regulator with PAS, ATPase and Fis domain